MVILIFKAARIADIKNDKLSKIREKRGHGSSVPMFLTLLCPFYGTN
jgi:hypothetical protein